MSISKGVRVSFTDENGKENTGTVIEFSGANDGTGQWAYWVKCGESIYSVREDGIEVVDDDSEYHLTETASGWAVKREDGAWAEFLSRKKAVEALNALRSGEATEGDYDWLEWE